MYSCNYFDNDTSTVGRQSRRTFSSDLIFIDDVSTVTGQLADTPTRRRCNLFFILESDLIFFDDASRHLADASNGRRYADALLTYTAITTDKL